MLFCGDRLNPRGFVAVLAIVWLMALPARAKTIESIGGSDMCTEFAGGVGSPMSIDVTTDIIVSYVELHEPQTVYEDGHFLLENFCLLEDQSQADVAKGLFGGGSVKLEDEHGNLLFEADVGQVILSEVNLPGKDPYLAGGGTYSGGVTHIGGVTGLPAAGTIADFVFDLSIDIKHFSLPFTGSSSMDFLPEPAYLVIVALFAPLLFVRRRRR